jgi:hypothetical protein
VPGQICVLVGRRFDESDGKHGSAAYYASLVSSFSPQQERLDSGDEKAAIVNEETRHSRQAASLFLMAHECPTRSSCLPNADETTVYMVVGDGLPPVPPTTSMPAFQTHHLRGL